MRPNTHFKVYLAAFEARPDQADPYAFTTSLEGHYQHILYVDEVEGRRGAAHQVVGNLADGFEFKFMFKTIHPERFAYTRWMKHVGWVEHGHLYLLRECLVDILPAGRQVAFGKLVVPSECVRTSQT